MAALLNRGNLVKELKLDASVAPADIYVRFICRIIEQSILPRKILVQSSGGDFEILAHKGKIAKFREFKADALEWVQSPISEAVRRTIKALKLSAGDALKNGQISLSMVSKKESAALASRDASVNEKNTGLPSASPKVLSLNEWKQNKTHEKAADDIVDSPILTDFFASIKSRVKFAYLEDIASGKTQRFGVAGTIDKTISGEFKPSFLKWRAAVLPALGEAPILLTMQSPSGGGSSLVCAAYGHQYLLAEFESKNFGIVVGSWAKVSRAN